MCLTSPLLTESIRSAAQAWATEERPSRREVLPGLWLSPMPMRRRRRLEGYSVAMIVTSGLLESEQLRAMCQGAQFDYELCKRLLAQLPPAAEVDVPRLAGLAALAHEHRLELVAEGHAMESIGQQLAESYEEINLLYNIIQSMTVVQHPERSVRLACAELLETLPYTWIGMVFREDPERMKKLSGGSTTPVDWSNPRPASPSSRSSCLRKAPAIRRWSSNRCATPCTPSSARSVRRRSRTRSEAIAVRWGC